MVATKKLYRVVEEYRYDGGRGNDQLQSEKVLYSGYDRLEAARVYYAQPKQGYSGPGSYYTVVTVKSKSISEE